MRKRVPWALAIVTGGIGLGALLGAAAHPVPKRAPEAAGRAMFVAPAEDTSARLTEAPPPDLTPYRDSYAPSWAHEELANWEPDYPAWTYSDLDRAPDPAPDEQPAEAARPDPAPQPEDTAPEPPAEGGLDALY